MNGEFVKAKQLGPGGNIGGNLRDGVAAGRKGQASGAMQAFVDVGHEGVKVLSTLFCNRRRCVEHIHQHGLATPDIAPEVNPTQRGSFPNPRQCAMEKTRADVRFSSGQSIQHSLKRNNRSSLAGVGCQFS
jgi:hypothetical protein